MKKFSILSIAFLAVFLVAGAATADIIPWVESPYQGDFPDVTNAFGNTNELYINWDQSASGMDNTSTMTSGIYGAGFVANGPSIFFSADLGTYDSYSDPTGASTNDGWWDAFVVNINQVGYYWELVDGGAGSITDPIVDPSYAGGTPTFDNSVLPGVTWVWGGTTWGSGAPVYDGSGNFLYNQGFEFFQTASNANIYLGLENYDENLPVYVSLVLDTKTNPTQDNLYLSGGKFQVYPVPEPAYMLLLGTCLVGLAGLGRKKLMKK